MMSDKHKLNKQLDKFAARGLIVSPADERWLTMVGYYRLKEFAAYYALPNQKQLMYQAVPLQAVIKRYNVDKNLRMHFLYAIEIIEVAIKAQLANILTQHTGEFGYLDITTWREVAHLNAGQRNKYQANWMQAVHSSTHHIDLHMLAEEHDLNHAGMPPVGVAVNLMTFGDLKEFVAAMQAPLQQQLARQFQCSVPAFLAWLKILNFSRNICAHNGNLIDVRIRTQPILEPAMAAILAVEKRDGQMVTTSRLALILVVVVRLIQVIDTGFNWHFILNDFDRLIGNEPPTVLGFKNQAAWQKVYSLVAPNQRRRN